uniref:Uncharacterized protein n=1 Tax=Octactis speculum TaxID=3111310 RepID=A0A7S2CLE9_9STRA|mmetsp:Transcript_37397/g.50600  ORF Transcript_37397/g.50600 Transcript_37397/m.50600 type:complete len:186 (+) Transcript_37397:1-558(+)
MMEEEEPVKDKSPDNRILSPQILIFSTLSPPPTLLEATSLSFDRGLSPLGDPSLSEWPDMMEEDPVYAQASNNARTSRQTLASPDDYLVPPQRRAQLAAPVAGASTLPYFSSSVPPSAIATSSASPNLDSPSKRICCSRPWSLAQPVHHMSQNPFNSPYTMDKYGGLVLSPDGTALALDPERCFQ